jgi:hypothetical protein
MFLLATVTTTLAQTPQSNFSAEDGRVHHPVRIPDAVFRALAEHEASRMYLEDESGASRDGQKPTPPKPDWYSAEKLRSPSSEIELYMVQGIGPLLGANVTQFWLVSYKAGTRQAVILWYEPEHYVSLRYRAGDPYPEIDAAKMSAVHIWNARFRYLNGRYVVVHSDDKPI